MLSVLNTIVLGFALVGVVAIGHWIFNGKWSTVGKIVGCLLLLGLVRAMFDPSTPLMGIFNPVAAMLATGGIVIITGYLVKMKRWAKDWRPRAVTVAVALALLATIWLPVVLSPGLLPSVPTAAAASPAASTPTTSPPAPTATRRSTHARRTNPCDDPEMTRDMRRDIGCVVP